MPGSPTQPPDAERPSSQPNEASRAREPQHERGLIDRRTLLKSGLLAGGTLFGGAAALGEVINGRLPLVGGVLGGSTSSTPGVRHPRGERHGAGGGSRAPGAPPGHVAPNILVIVVDQLRFPQWFSASAAAAAAMPNLRRLQRGAVSFANHYTASNDCTPARATLLTGLYTHQTGCMITGGSTLDPGFPTWGTMLREHGYQTYWYGKWHLTHGDNWWRPYLDAGALEPYGFSGGTYPSPDGAPGQGWRVDPHVARQFERWMASASSSEPWCTTVSFVNPHDIAWWYLWSDRTAAEAHAPRMVHALPANFETPKQLAERRKPRLQRSLQETAAQSFGEVPFEGHGAAAYWLPFMDLYLKLLARVDAHIGQVLDALESQPEVARNTVVVFTSDHGEYGSSHGLRGKGGAAYDEAIRVPLMVKDLRGGRFAAAPGRARNGLTSSVDVAPMLLSIATGSDSWRRDSHYSHLARRHDLARMLANPLAPGRAHVLHTTDEIVTEFAVAPYSSDAPLHVVALRTPRAKYAIYSYFQSRSIELRERGQEAELYDYSTRGGRMEIDNIAGRSRLEARMRAQLRSAFANELREQLPRRLSPARERGFADYLDTAGRAAASATARRRRLLDSHRVLSPERASEKLGLRPSPTERARLRAARRATRRRTPR
jgi:arylsulfatase A-like enzyme